MATIDSLPPEVLSNVFSNLNPFDLESVAKMMNRKFYDATHHLIEPHIPWLNNVRSMVKLFPPQSTDTSRRLLPSYPGHVPAFHHQTTAPEELPRRSYEPLGLDPKGGPYIRSSPPDLRSWMKLDGTFEWLEPLSKDLTVTMSMYTGEEGDNPAASKTAVDKLVEECKTLGLTLPKGFADFLRSDRLHFRIPSGGAWYFTLSPLIKCPADVDGGAGGFILRFYSDQLRCAFQHLYLNTKGHHCILYSRTKLYEDKGDPRYVNQFQSDDEDSSEDDDEPEEDGSFILSGLTFEEFLAATYYQELLGFGVEDSKGLKDFIKRVYRSPVEVEDMREHNPAIETFLQAQQWKGKEHYDELHKDEENEYMARLRRQSTTSVQSLDGVE